MLQWIEEVRAICGHAIPVILVACKTDLRDRAIANGTFNTAQWIDADTVSPKQCEGAARNELVLPKARGLDPGKEARACLRVVLACSRFCI